MTTVILAAVIPLSVNFLLAAATYGTLRKVDQEFPDPQKPVEEAKPH